MRQNSPAVRRLLPICGLAGLVSILSVAPPLLAQSPRSPPAGRPGRAAQARRPRLRRRRRQARRPLDGRGEAPQPGEAPRPGDLLAAALDDPLADAGLVVDLLDRPEPRPARHLRLPEARPADLQAELRHVRRAAGALPLRQGQPLRLWRRRGGRPRPPRLPAPQALPPPHAAGLGGGGGPRHRRRRGGGGGGRPAPPRRPARRRQPPAGRDLLGAPGPARQAGAGGARAGDLPAQGLRARRAPHRARHPRPLGPHRQAVLLHLRALLHPQGGRRLLGRGGRAGRQQGDDRDRDQGAAGRALPEEEAGLHQDPA